MFHRIRDEEPKDSMEQDASADPTAGLFLTG
jgi:hypothetical protein